MNETKIKYHIASKELLKKMTLEEKVGQLMQISYSSVSEEEAYEWVTKRYVGSFLHVLGKDAEKLQKLSLKTRLGIPLIFGIDATHGHALNDKATIFPSQLSMSCSWNPELIKEVGGVTAREVRADGLHWTFSPVLCVGRDTRWGRINETFGEDPFIIGKLGEALIEGYQGAALSGEDSILACAKHYIGYGESVGGRDSYDTQLSLRKIREVFLPPFKKAVDSGCATVMAAYQSIDGTPVSTNRRLLKNILKDELGFDGFVVTDWKNVDSLIINQNVAENMNDAAKKTLLAGNDMIMNSPDFYYSTIELVKSGLVSEDILDEAVLRILNIKLRMGLFDNKSKVEFKNNQGILACKNHLKTNMDITEESIVLLENKNNILPIGNNIKRIAVIGPNADNIKSQLGDWTFFTHPEPNPNAKYQKNAYTMLQGIKELASEKGIEVLFNKGCEILDEDEDKNYNHDNSVDEATKIASISDVIIAVVGDSIEQNGECKDRANLELSNIQLDLLKSLKKCNKPLIIVLVNGKPLSIPWIKENADALLETFNSGNLGGKALAHILFGLVNPSGKLTISFPYHSGQIPVYYNRLPGWHGNKYMDLKEEALYSFGYGISFNTYKYSNIRLSKNSCKKGETVLVSVDVKNEGEYEGKEIVQLYINDKVSSVVTPVKELKGFKKVTLNKGETKTVSIPLEIDELYIINCEEEYIVEPGEFEIMVGPNSIDSSLLKTSLWVVE